MQSVYLFNVMLGVVMLNVVMKNAFMLSVIVLSVVVLSVIVLSVVVLSVIVLSAIVLIVVVLSAVVLSVVVLNVVMLSVMAPKKLLRHRQLMLSNKFSELKKTCFAFFHSFRLGSMLILDYLWMLQKLEAIFQKSWNNQDIEILVIELLLV